MKARSVPILRRRLLTPVGHEMRNMNRIQPSLDLLARPRNGFEDHGWPLASNAHTIAFEPKRLGQAHGLAAPDFEELGLGHSNVAT